MGLDRSDPTFVADLLNSLGAVLRAAQWLEGFGFQVTIPALRIRPDAARRFDYGDEGDLQVDGERVEVKRRAFEFSSHEDFPYRSVFVDVAHAWDKADPKPLRYLIFDRDMSHVLLVPGYSRPLWQRSARFDRHCGRERVFYECPIRYCRFEAVTIPVAAAPQPAE
jgi:hypothetical protein